MSIEAPSSTMRFGPGPWRSRCAVRRGIGFAVQAVQRARGLAQRLERLQQGVQRGRDHPARVVDRIGETGFAGQGARRTRPLQRRALAGGRRGGTCGNGESGHLERVAQAALHAAHAGHEVARRGSVVAASPGGRDRCSRRRRSRDCAASHGAPRSAICCSGPPARQHRAALGTAPGQGIEHARIGMEQRGQCGGQVGAADAELAARIGGRFDLGAQAAVGRQRTSAPRRSRPVGRRARCARPPKRSSAASSSASWAAMCSACDGGAALMPAMPRQPIAGAPGRAPLAPALRQAVEHLLLPSAARAPSPRAHDRLPRRSSAPRHGARSRSDRRGPRHATAPGSAGRTTATSNTMPSMIGTTAMLAAIAKSSSELPRLSSHRGLLRRRVRAG